MAKRHVLRQGRPTSVELPQKPSLTKGPEIRPSSCRTSLGPPPTYGTDNLASVAMCHSTLPYRHQIYSFGAITISRIAICIRQDRGGVNAMITFVACDNQRV